ncbi:MAG: GWxTD domain-containing protein [Candidatus Aminicenantes bacterium]|nr:GWxTD domain-containing protein [Candidatus Aminicenantes bacterium]
MKRIIFLFFELAVLAGNPVLAAKAKNDPWKSWLVEVSPIMTRLEKQTVNFIKTEEDRQRYQEAFWKVRDPDPATPANEFKDEYFRRLEYTRKSLNGQSSDRGKIYLLLGKPLEIKDFSGYEDLVDCQLWVYQNLSQKGLASFINLLFFRYHNLGDYQLFYPGIHKPMDLLSPYAAYRQRTLVKAYNTLLGNSVELAQASLSVIPGQGDPDTTPVTATSGSVMTDIFSLPERQVETNYLQKFRAPVGKVEVSQSTSEIRGKLTWAVTRRDGLNFINYAFIPDFIGLKPYSPDTQHAELTFYLTAVDAQGQTIFQDDRRLDLKLPKAKAAEILEKKVLFQDFFPIIPGTFTVTLACINKTSGEFFSQSQELVVAPDGPVVLFGFAERTSADPRRYEPFAAGQRMIQIDPRGLYAAQDSLVGIVESGEVPEITLSAAGGDKKTIATLAPTTSRDRLHSYRYELKDLAAGNYVLQVIQKGSLLLSQPVFLMPAYMKIKRPYLVEEIDAADSEYNFRFIVGQEYMNRGEVDEAIRCFSLLPAEMVTGQSRPVIARAYYQKRDFAKVLDLLEQDGVEKTYTNLLLLANSAIETRSFAKASAYLEALRNYSDTAEISRLLAATYLSQGDSKKARLYYDHARQLDVQAQAVPPTDK